jgi:DNA-binding MarR family transcriptional regulator
VTPLNQSDKSLLLDNQLCFALYAASLAMSKAYKPHLNAVGLTYPQYLVMLVLWENQQLSISEIGDLLYLDSGTLTPLLKRLESSNYVVRERDREDERRVNVRLTVSGKNLKKKILPLPNVILENTQCSRPQAMKLAQDLRALGDRLRESP